MSFCFNFDVPAQTIDPDDVDGNRLQKDDPAKSVSNHTSHIDAKLHREYAHAVM